MPRARARLAKDLRRHSRDFVGLTRKLHRGISPGELHRLRILTRRIRAVIWLSRHTRNGPGLKRLQKELRGLGRLLGSRRTLDVLTCDASRYGLDASRLKSRRDSSGKKIRKFLSRSERRRFSKLLKRAAESLESLDETDLKIPLRVMLCKLEDLRETKPRGPEQWHRLRIEAKKIRYVAEALGLDVPEIRDLQVDLGKAHDLRLLRDTLGDRAALGRDERSCWRRARKRLPDLISKTEHRLARRERRTRRA